MVQMETQNVKQYTVTIIDTVGIQDYIFSSNMLRHNIGASYLVEWATREAVYRTLVTQHGERTNVDHTGHRFPERRIESGNLLSELVYAGGGNTVLLFANRSIAVDFARAYTRVVLTEAPGLQIVLTHGVVDWAADENDPQTSLAQVIADTLTALNAKKLDRRFSTPLFGLGVTADCQYTGLPAVNRRRKSTVADSRAQRVSSEIDRKWDAAAYADQRLHQLLPAVKDHHLEFVYDLEEHLGIKGEARYMAIIHADGNGMGKRVQAIAAHHQIGSERNRNYIEAMRNFSDAVEKAALSALRSTVEMLIYAIEEQRGQEAIAELVRVYDNKLPFRPLVFGGDDVTFLCDGRLALPVTEHYLRELQKFTLPPDGKPFYARAGVAVTKVHYPFTRAYRLAEDLADSAKQLIREKRAQLGDQESFTALDWHFAVSGPILSLDEIRAREYRSAQQQDLCMRPVTLDDVGGEEGWRNWTTFQTIIEQFAAKEGVWNGRRNKLKQLRTALRQGSEAVRQFVLAYEPRQQLPGVPGEESSREVGYIGNRCTCFDAVEALDFYLSLAEPRGGAA